MQRSGRKGHAMFRVVVQDSRRTPTSGKVVAQLGSYDPHSKAVIVDTEKAQFYLDNGAQPSNRVAPILAKQGVKLPKWVIVPESKKRTVRNADKRRSTRPPEAVEKTPSEPVASEEPEIAEQPEEKPEQNQAIESTPEAEEPAAAPEETPPAETEPTPVEETTAAPEETK
jgi:small subunit ribosomal protein S16